MKIDSLTIAYIKNAIHSAKLVGIENLIVETDKVRGMNEIRTAIIIQKTDVPPLPFKSIGLSRIDILLDRLEIAQTSKKFEVTYTESDDGEFVRSLNLKGDNVKIDYRCANPSTIQAPKSFDKPLRYKIVLTPEFVLMMSKGIGAMGNAEYCTLIGSKDSLKLSIEDINRDSFQFELPKKHDIVDGSLETDFEFDYPSKIILPLLKQNPEGSMYIASTGTIKININGFDFYVPRREV